MKKTKSCPSDIKSRKILKALNITTNIKQISSVFFLLSMTFHKTKKIAFKGQLSEGDSERD